MLEVSLVATFCLGGISGFINSMVIFSWADQRKRASLVRRRIGCLKILDANNICLESKGLNYWVLQELVLFSGNYYQIKKSGTIPPWNIAMKKNESLIKEAGLEGLVNEKGIYWLRLIMSLSGLLVGMLMGLFFSEILSVLLAFVMFVVAFLMPVRSLKNEATLRAFCAEYQLSQMIEILILGLQSGLSFDSSIKLYTEHFKGSLSGSFSRALNQWQHGLLNREVALKSLSESYKSALLSRAIESIIRSLRFGSSLTESLSLISSEARSVRKTALQERIAKAPVKMLLPVGTLILPAMLILIMGPILLDLATGF